MNMNNIASANKPYGKCSSSFPSFFFVTQNCPSEKTSSVFREKIKEREEKFVQAGRNDQQCSCLFFFEKKKRKERSFDTMLAHI